MKESGLTPLQEALVNYDVSELTGKAQTVLGPIDPEDLGVTSSHEHLFVDLSAMFAEPSECTEKELAHQPVTLKNLWWVVYNPYRNLDNLLLRDEEVAITEASFYKRAGGGTIVDVSTIGLGRDPLALASVAWATGLNVIMGSGYYVSATYSANIDGKTDEDISEEIMRDVWVGVGNTHICAGIIGEIGCTWPLADSERKVLRAAAYAQQRTGAPLSIHPGRNPSAPLEIIEILGKAGADISRTVIGHVDRTLKDPEDRRKLAETGCYLEYDLFGLERYYPLALFDIPNDHQRVNEIIQLIEQGYLNQILISHDISLKIRLKRYGGHGYDHILRNVVPMMRDKGMSEKQINALLVENPKRLLRFV